MKIGFCYDKVENHPSANEIEDVTAEYESPETIETMVGILSEIGEKVIKLPWHKYIFNDLKKHEIDVVFNITESWGSRNRESYIPNICEILKIPYTGSDGLAMGISLDKGLTKQIAQARKINTAKFKRVTDVNDLKSIKIDYPVFVKPNNEGSSIGIRRSSLANNERELVSLAGELLTKYQKSIIVEKFLPGREFVVGLLGNKEPEVLPVAEIKVNDGNFSFYPYEYKQEHNKQIVFSSDIDKNVKEQMINDTLAIFKDLGCRDLARADFKLDENGVPYFLEINPLPGLSPDYGIYPELARKGGKTIKEVFAILINQALTRKKGGK